jgi:Protein of unknown function (DUF2510)
VRQLGRIARRVKQPDGPRSRQEPVARGAWYQDPFGTAGERWWDGTKWTQEVRGAPTPGAATAEPGKRQVSGFRNSAASRGADERVDGKSRACRRCHGTGEVTYDFGGHGKCPECLGKGRTTPEDRRANLLLTAIPIALVIVVIVFHIHAY